MSHVWPGLRDALLLLLCRHSYPDGPTPLHAAVPRRILGLLSSQQAVALAAALPLQQLNASGLLAVPGFIDMHVHVCGGGGEAGPASRTPEAALSQLLRAGITTVVGVTGTDSVSRSQVRRESRHCNLHAEAACLAKPAIHGTKPQPNRAGMQMLAARPPAA